MRIKQKKQMLTIAQTYRKFADEIVNALTQQDKEHIITCLEQAQESAIEWGETVEKVEPQSADFIHVLENLCELYYEISQAVLKMGETGQWNALVEWSKERLEAMMSELGEAVENLPVTYEFVFMPYKASMWDCMESVYLAAAEDPNCNAVVVPIPYYNIEEQGKRKISCYEGDQLPDDIPVTYYEDYDLSERQPDVVFIHNPYDEYNLITSVFPEYFSYNIKKYADQLVYIPYYMTGGVVPDTHRMLSVHKHMDKMVLQSPQEIHYYEGDIFEDKILPLGSPKIDKMISYEKDKPECPSEWAQIIAGRKVFFYNTSISSLLHDTENALAKMEWVFQSFQKRDDVALIWRPHPLLESTLKGLRVNDYNRFMEMKQRFLDSGVGIYDQTADINKTIALSDAYIGEASSSVVHLFGVTGKPIFLLSGGLTKDLDKVELQETNFTNIVEAGGKLWTMIQRFNALANIDMETGELHIVAPIPGYPLTRGGLITALYPYENKIIMSPNSMDKIVIYDVDTGEFSFEQLENPEHVENLGGFVRWQNRFLIMPSRYPAIVEYDDKTGKFIYHRELMEKVKNKGVQYKDRRGFIGGSALLEEQGLLVFTLVRTNLIVIWDLEKRTYEIVSFGGEDQTFGNLFPYKDGVLVREFYGTTMYYWDMKKGEVTKWVPELPEDFETRLTPFEDDFPFAWIMWMKDNFLLLPRLGNQILELDKNELKLTKYPIDISAHIKPPQTGCFDNRWGHLRGTYAWDVEKGKKHELTDFWIRFADDGSMMHIDLETNETYSIQPHLNLDEVAKHIPVADMFSRFSQDIPYAATENGYVPLDRFIDAFVAGELNNSAEEQIKAYSEIADNMDGTCGQKVFEAMRNIILESV